jgi:septum formation protein
MAARFVLASASPARLQTLRAAGIEAEVIVSGVDEDAVDASAPESLCRTLAALKAEAVAARIAPLAGDGSPVTDPAAGGPPDPAALVLGCDSVLAFDGEILGKPADPAEAVRRWRAMRGRHGVLYTGHCLVRPATGERAEEVAATTVHFADLSDAEIEAYVATGEPLRVAGAFTIDSLGAPFVSRIEGDPGTVVGLSMPLLRLLLRRLDVEITSLWRAP